MNNKINKCNKNSTFLPQNINMHTKKCAPWYNDVSVIKNYI